MVAVAGLEPARREATDFESVVYTNFTTPPICSVHYTDETFRRKDKAVNCESVAD